MNILLLIGVCVIGFTKINYNLINFFSNINIIWSRPLVNVIFLCLRFIAAIKVVIAMIRGLIKARRMTKFETKASTSKTNFSTLKPSLEKLNNKCIVCLDELYSVSSQVNPNSERKTLMLKCNHIFHVDCFKKWYKHSGCPYCRAKVEL